MPQEEAFVFETLGGLPIAEILDLKSFSGRVLVRDVVQVHGTSPPSSLL